MDIHVGDEVRTLAGSSKIIAIDFRAERVTLASGELFDIEEIYKSEPMHPTADSMAAWLNGPLLEVRRRSSQAKTLCQCGCAGCSRLWLKGPTPQGREGWLMRDHLQSFGCICTSSCRCVTNPPGTFPGLDHAHA